MVTGGIILFLVWWLGLVCSYTARGYLHVLLPISIYLLI